MTPEQRKDTIQELRNAIADELLKQDIFSSKPEQTPWRQRVWPWVTLKHHKTTVRGLKAELQALRARLVSALEETEYLHKESTDALNKAFKNEVEFQNHITALKEVNLARKTRLEELEQERVKLAHWLRLHKPAEITRGEHRGLGLADTVIRYLAQTVIENGTHDREIKNGGRNS